MKDTEASPLHTLSSKSPQFLCFCSCTALSLGCSSLRLLPVETSPSPPGPAYEPFPLTSSPLLPTVRIKHSLPRAPTALCLHSRCLIQVLLSPCFPCLYFAPPPPKLVGPDLPWFWENSHRRRKSISGLNLTKGNFIIKFVSFCVENLFRLKHSCRAPVCLS